MPGDVGDQGWRCVRKPPTAPPRPDRHHHTSKPHPIWHRSFALQRDMLRYAGHRVGSRGARPLRSANLSATPLFRDFIGHDHGPNHRRIGPAENRKGVCGREAYSLLSETSRGQCASRFGVAARTLGIVARSSGGVSNLPEMRQMRTADFGIAAIAILIGPVTKKTAANARSRWCRNSPSACKSPFKVRIAFGSPHYKRVFHRLL